MDEFRFLDHSYDVSFLNFVPFLETREKMPLFRSVKGIRGHSPADVIPRKRGDLVQWALDAIIDRAYKPGSEFHGKRLRSRYHHLIESNATGLFIDLDHQLLSADLHDLSDELVASNFHNVCHFCVWQSNRFHDRA